MLSSGRGARPCKNPMCPAFSAGSDIPCRSRTGCSSSGKPVSTGSRSGWGMKRHAFRNTGRPSCAQPQPGWGSSWNALTHRTTTAISSGTKGIPRAVDRALSSIDSPHLGFCYDSSHDFLYARHPTDILRRWGGRLATTHRSDNDGTGDRHWIPGRGTIDWAGIRDALPKRRPLPLSLEVVPIDPGSQSAESFLRESMERGAALVRMMTGGQV
jgi:hypothetical protein